MSGGGLKFPLSSSESWKDVTPLKQDDGPSPVVPISYTPRFIEVMDYFRAIMSKGEKSQRALDLTKEVIKVNPANYTGWLFRRECLFALGASLDEELKFIDMIAEQSSKNYQLWHHRRVIVERRNDAKGEIEATTKALIRDPKNYHVWAHRQWVLKTFNLFKDELKFVETLLQVDVRNNSAWNQRYFVISNTSGFKPGVIEREIAFAFKSLKRAPNNMSPWNYLRGIVNAPEFSAIEAIEQGTITIMKQDSKCAQGFGFAVDMALKFPTAERLEKALQYCKDLAASLDQIRAKYWEYQEGLVKDALSKAQSSNTGSKTASGAPPRSNGAPTSAGSDDKTPDA